MGIGAAGTTVVGVAAGSDSRHTVTFWLRGGENTSTGVHARYSQGTLAGCPTPESVIALATVGISNLSLDAQLLRSFAQSRVQIFNHWLFGIFANHKSLCRCLIEGRKLLVRFS
jgi:hypothetical protein